MARRRPPDPARDGRQPVPYWLACFRPSDWTAFPYDLSLARSRYHAERRRWAAEHGYAESELGRAPRTSPSS